MPEFWFGSYTNVMGDITTGKGGGDWVKGTWGLSTLFSTFSESSFQN